MIRESLAPDAVFGVTSIRAGGVLSRNTVVFKYRKTTGSKVFELTGNSASIPEYIRIVRNRKDVSSYVSDVHGNWRLIGSLKMNISETIYVGLAATSATTASSTVVKFEEVSIAGGIQTEQPGTLQQETVTMDQDNACEFEIYLRLLNTYIADKFIKKLLIYNYN